MTLPLESKGGVVRERGCRLRSGGSEVGPRLLCSVRRVVIFYRLGLGDPVLELMEELKWVVI